MAIGSWWVRGLVVAGVLAGGGVGAAAPPPDGGGEVGLVPLPPLVAALWARGRASEARGDLVDASVAYGAVVRSVPQFRLGVLAWMRVLEARGRHEEALAASRRSSVPEVLAARGQVLLALDRPEDALQTFRRLSASAPSMEALRLEVVASSQLDGDLALGACRAWLAWPEEAQASPRGLPSADAAHQVQAVRAVIAALGQEGRWRDALSVAEAASARLRDEVAGALAEDVAGLTLEVAARQLMAAAAEPLSTQDALALDRVRRAWRSGDVAGAWRGLGALTHAAPRSAEVWSLMATVSLARGDVAAADDALQRAERLAPLDPTLSKRLGDLLTSAYGGRERAAAVAAYARAVRRDPSWASAWRAKALAEISVGDTDAAIRSLGQVRDLGDAEQSGWAQDRADQLARPRPEVSPLSGGSGCPEWVAPAACLTLYRARVLEEWGDLDGALHQLNDAVLGAPDWSRPLNLRASLALGRGDVEAAARDYRSSLALDPSQPAPYLALGDLLRGSGQQAEADALVDQALARGIGDVYFGLAQREASQGHWDLAAAHLRAYSTSSRTGRFDADVTRLAARVTERRTRRRWVWGGSGGLLLLGGLVLWRRHRSGASLTDLVARAPRTARDVARIVAALRHEVLKHDTTVLGEVADALEAGDQEMGRYAAGRLFATRGTLARARDHVASLEAIARRHGVRLRLRRRDPVFRPILLALDRLAGLRGALEQGDARCAPALRRIAVVLNDDGFDALGRMVRSLATLELSASTLGGLAARVRAEPALSGVSEVVVTAPTSVHVRIFRGDLEDVVCNLLRNALIASRDAGAGPVTLSLTVELDPVTFLEDAVIRVCDRAPGTLTTAALSDRLIERGLGIVVDTVRQVSGTLSVEPVARPGVGKALVFRLPVVEQIVPSLGDPRRHGER